MHDYSVHDLKYKLARRRGDPGWGGDLAHQRISHWKRTINDLLASDEFQKKGKLLELGCGSGSLSLIMAARGFEVTGIDISPTAITWANERAQFECSDCRFLNGNVTDLSRFETGEFDAILDGNCLHCIIGSDRELALREIFRVLRPKGTLFVSTICEPFTGGDGAPTFDSYSQSLLENGQPYRHMASPTSILNELNAVGFRVSSYDVQKRAWWSHMKVILSRP